MALPNTTCVCGHRRAAHDPTCRYPACCCGCFVGGVIDAKMAFNLTGEQARLILGALAKAASHAVAAETVNEPHLRFLRATSADLDAQMGGPARREAAADARREGIRHEDKAAVRERLNIKLLYW